MASSQADHTFASSTRNVTFSVSSNFLRPELTSQKDSGCQHVGCASVGWCSCPPCTALMGYGTICHLQVQQDHRRYLQHALHAVRCCAPEHTGKLVRHARADGMPHDDRLTEAGHDTRTSYALPGCSPVIGYLQKVYHV
jgi:hypothetical protein